MRLVIVSHTPHYQQDGKIVGWGPTVREIDYLAQLFDPVVHIAPLHGGASPNNVLPYESGRVRLRSVSPAGGERIQDKLTILARCPSYLKAISNELCLAQAVHVRAPANISLAAILLLAFQSRPQIRWVKYAGNWRPGRAESLSYTLQRWWLHGGLRRGVVTVNGRWPGQPRHVYSFLNPSLTETDIRNGQATARQKSLIPPYRLLFAGRLEAAKGVGRLLQIAHHLCQRGLPIVLDLLGDGSERPGFERWVKGTGLESQINFHGWLPKSDLAPFYARAHFFVFPTSASEGWPKVLSEAMAYGAVPLAGAVSSIPQILGESGAGMALPPEDIDAYTQAILAYVENPETWRAESRAGAQAAALFTYENYIKALRQMFYDAWGIRL